MTPEQVIALRNLLAAAETVAYHWQTASAVALPLRAAIAEMQKANVDSAIAEMEEEANNE